MELQIAIIFDAVVRDSTVLSNTVSVDRIKVAAPLLLGAAAACVVFVSFAAGRGKLYWSGLKRAEKGVVTIEHG